MSPSDSSLEEIEAALDRATELETEAAIELLRSARAELRDGRVDGSVDAERRESLEHRFDQRIKELENRDAYSGGLGSAMNPEDDDAP